MKSIQSVLGLSFFLVINSTIAFAQSLSVVPANPTVGQPQQRIQFKSSNGQLVTWSLSGNGSINSAGLYIGPRLLPLCSTNPISVVTASTISSNSSTNVYAVVSTQLSLLPSSPKLLPEQQVILMTNADEVNWSLSGPGQLIPNNDGTATYVAPSTNPSPGTFIYQPTVTVSTCGQAATSNITVTFAPPNLQQIVNTSTINLSQLAQDGATLNQPMCWTANGWMPGNCTGSGGVSQDTVESLIASSTITPSQLAQDGATLNQAMCWTASGWAPGSCGGSSTINLSQLAQTGATTNQAMCWNGTSWAPGSCGGSGGSNGVTLNLDGNSEGLFTTLNLITSTGFNWNLSANGSTENIALALDSSIVPNLTLSQTWGIGAKQSLVPSATTAALNITPSTTLPSGPAKGDIVLDSNSNLNSYNGTNWLLYTIQDSTFTSGLPLVGNGSNHITTSTVTGTGQFVLNTNPTLITPTVTSIINFQMLSGNGTLLVTNQTTVPTTSSSNCSQGTTAYNTTNFYICVSANTWKTIALSSF